MIPFHSRTFIATSFHFRHTLMDNDEQKEGGEFESRGEVAGSVRWDVGFIGFVDGDCI